MVRKVGGTRKKAHKAPAKTHHKKRRVSGAHDVGGLVQKAGGLVVGSVAARELNTIAVKMFPTLTPLVSGIVQMAVGYMLPKMVKGPFFANMGDGMIANGGMVAIVATGIISGTNDRVAYRINGTPNLPIINGTANLKVVNGPTTRISSQPTGNPKSIAIPRRSFNHYV